MNAQQITAYLSKHHPQLVFSTNYGTRVKTFKNQCTGQTSSTHITFEHLDVAEVKRHVSKIEVPLDYLESLRQQHLDNIPKMKLSLIAKLSGEEAIDWYDVDRMKELELAEVYLRCINNVLGNVQVHT